MSFIVYIEVISFIQRVTGLKTPYCPYTLIHVNNVCAGPDPWKIEQTRNGFLQVALFAGADGH